MSLARLEFLSPALVDPQFVVSPLRRALSRAPARFRDLSLDPKVEIRGDVSKVTLEEGDELIALTPRRALLLPAGDARAAVGRLRAAGLRAYDVTGALAGIALDGERLMRRLTDMDLGALPAAGPFARVPAVLVRDDEDRFRVYFQQELGHYVCEVVLDMHDGLRGSV